MSDGSEEYSVGYGRPPKSTQFQKGISGNPKGRRKKRSDIERLKDLVKEPVKAIIDGKEEQINVRKALILSARAKAMNGGIPAMRQFVALLKEMKIDIVSDEEKAHLDGSIQKRAAEQLRKLREEISNMDAHDELMAPYCERHRHMILSDPKIKERQIEFWVALLEEAPNDVALKTRLEALKAEKLHGLVSPKLVKEITRRHRERNSKTLKNRK